MVKRPDCGSEETIKLAPGSRRYDQATMIAMYNAVLMAHARARKNHRGQAQDQQYGSPARW